MRNVYGWSLVAVACLTGAAWAQNVKDDAKKVPPAARERAGKVERVPGARAPAERAPAGAAEREGASQSDQQIAAVIFAGCRNHIEIAKFAQARLQDPQAKQFAEKMVNDHNPGCEKMRELAGDLVSATREGATIERGTAPGAVPGAPVVPGRKVERQSSPKPTRRRKPAARNVRSGGKPFAKRPARAPTSKCSPASARASPSAPVQPRADSSTGSAFTRRSPISA